MQTRRKFIAGLAGVPLLGHAEGAPRTKLRHIAAAKGILFGTEVTADELAGFPDYADLIARECAIITPGIEAKWRNTEPGEGRFEFRALDRVVAFAQSNGIKLHMHNLVWAVGLPPWTVAALQEGRGPAVLARHIDAVAGRYRGGVYAWDVVNEPVDPRWPGDALGLCTTPWRQALGPHYAEIALADAAQADPGARLWINDDDLEYDTDVCREKRLQYVRLIESWLRRGAKLQGFGLEAHFKPWLPFNDRAYRAFLQTLAGFGLAIHVTEFDVCDRYMPADFDVRDRCVAEAAKRYLDVVLDEPAVATLICWGLTDRFSWMRQDQAGARSDGLAPRPLPFDSSLVPKRLYFAIQAALMSARAR